MSSVITEPVEAGALPITIREATPDDDAQICAHMRRNGMPGPISLTYAHEPSFFQSVQVEGYEHRIAVAERDGVIVGAGMMAKRRVYVNGEPAEIGYISSLRTDPDIRSGTALARGNKLFKQWHDEGFGVPFYTCAILKSNTVARTILTSGRAGLPKSHEMGGYCTVSIPLIRRPYARPARGLRIVRGGQVGAEAIAECLAREGRLKQFYPVYTVRDLLDDSGILRGLRLDDFHVALSGDRVVGVTACWNQLDFRRVVVTGYSGGMRWMKPILSPVMRMLGLPRMSEPGEALPNLMAACIAIEDNDPRVFKSLLDSILRAETGKGMACVMVGLMQNDPLFAVAKRYPNMPTPSCVYLVEWDGADAVARLDGRVPYLELGSL